MSSRGLPFAALISLASVIGAGTRAEAAAPVGQWWNASYMYRQKLNLAAGSTAIPTQYSVRLQFDHAALVSGLQSLASGDDVRVAYWNGSGWVELDRRLDDQSAWNSATTQVWFRTQAAISASATDDNYYLYYGNTTAGAPPSDWANVFLLYDDFNDGSFDTGRWVCADPLSVAPPPACTESAVAPGTLTLADNSAAYATAAYAFGTNTRWESRLRLATSTPPTYFYNYWGASDMVAPANPYQSDWITFWADPGQHWVETANDGSATQTLTAPVPSTTTAFHVYTFDREGATGVRFFQDGTQDGYLTTDIPDAILRALVWNDEDQNPGIILDWVRVRRYVTPEPTVSLNAGESAVQMRITSGSYTGNGVDNRAVFVGFQPDVVVVKRDEDGSFGVVRTSTMAGDLTKSFDPAGLAAFAGGIKSLTASGFFLGTDPNVNALGASYYWVALKAAAATGEMAVGSYLGDGSDDRNITTLGFQPDYVWVLPQEAFGPVHRTSTMAGDISYDFRRSRIGADRIQAMLPNGFQVGTSAEVNSGSGSKLYHYVAWKNTAGRIQVGTYTGTGLNGQVFDILGFTPEWVIVKRDPDTATWGYMTHKPWSTGPNVDYGLFFSDRVGGIHEVEQLRPSGFMVGYDGPGDDTNESGILYHYIALGPHTTSACSPLTTTVDGTYAGYLVTAPSSCELGFGRPGGGGIHLLFDLEYDPGRLYDLAGSDVPAKEPGLWSDEVGGVAGTNYQSGRNLTGFKITPLEVTGTRVKMRQDAFFQAPDNGAILAGVKGSGDYTIYPTGRMALHWVRRYTNTAAINYTFQQLQTVTHFEPSGPLNTWLTYTDTGAIPPARSTPPDSKHTFLLTQIEQPEVRTDVLTILARDWAAETSADVTSDGTSLFLENTLNSGAGSINPGSPAETWDFLFYFKPTNLVDNNDPAVLSRRNDYRGPDPLVVTVGAGWNENTADADFFNESEGAYTLDLNPSTGLAFDMNGSTTQRTKPLFKIRQWRSLVDAPQVTLEGVSLTKDVDYRADVKPVSGAHFAQNLRWHSTLQDTAAVTSPDVGSAGSVVGSPSFVAARYGSGASVTADTQYVSFPTTDFDKAKGAVEFWYQPTYANTDGLLHDICGFYLDANNLMSLEKRADNILYFRITSNGTVTEVRATTARYSWRAYDWVHIRLDWDDSLMVTDQMRISVNGSLIPSDVSWANDYNSANLSLASSFRFGNTNGDTSFAPGVYDEIHAYGGSQTTPTLLAYGGLTSSASEYLADPAKNATLSLAGVDATRRGPYLYLGADSQFRGLNVVLSTAGAGVAAGAMLWEYWNGTTGAWADLKAVTGFADQTSSFTRSGSISWTGDPPNWAPYSVNGGPDLYYTRAHLPTGSSYSTPPIERVVKTDILLFQYCGDIAMAARTFAFSVPAPTAVRLMSFSAVAGDGSVTLEWRTGSELDNLGFHLYRGPSADGPWTRLTSSLIPGLGSSPLGQAYSWLDSGLTNGTRYYYRLEDVDTASKSTFHGPISAVPGTAPVTEPSPPGEDGDGDGGGDGSERGDPGTSSCPSWVLAAAPDAVAPRCTRHGDPESVSLQVLARDSSSATLELDTGGFWALHDAAGTVRVFVPGLEFPSDPQAPALPLRRTLVEAVVGRGVELVSAEVYDLQAFRDLRPSAVGRAELAVGRDGTVRPARRPLAAPVLTRGYLPREVARLAGTVFQGETKSAVVEITPVRFSGSGLVLAGRVRVRLAFTGVVEGESGTGSQGRSLPRRKAFFRDVLARLHTSRKGLHAVTFEELFPGRPRGLSTALLRLQRQGEAVGFHVEPQGAVFGPGSTLFFYAERTASSTDYSSEVAYELVRSSSGVRMGTVSAPPLGTPLTSSSTGFSSFETNRIYQPGLLEAPDVWLWDYLPSGASRREGFALSGVDTAAAEPARLTVYLQGGSESGQAVDHHVALLVNGAGVGETSFAGKRPQRVELLVPATLLREGANELVLTNVADTGVASGVFLDRFEISYPQASLVRRGVFEGVWAQTGTVEVEGLSGPAVILRDAGVPGPEGSTGRWLRGFQATGSSVRFQAEAGHRYLVVSPEGLLSPRVGRIPTSTLKEGSNQADYLVIAPRELLEAASPLLERRRSQGLTSRAVAFEQIASEFGHGQESAEAIRSFLSYAYHSWQPPSPRYVLLLGDATDDPQRFQSTSWPSPLPALMTKTSYLWTVSDPALAAANGEDALPDLAIGRLPATTREDAEALVSKLLAWEETGQDLSGKAVLVADKPDAGGDFEADVEDVRASFLAGRDATVLKVRELGGSTRAAILDAFDDGASLMSYVGHGGTAVWSSSGVLASWDTPLLRAQSRQPVLLTWNCLNGYFVAPNFDSLSEALLKAGGRGAIAAFSPSGLSLDGPAHQYHRAIVAELASGAHERLGDAILAAQRAYAQSGLMPELLGVYQLLGDPALRIR